MEHPIKRQMDTYVAWLADAHAMELALVKTLQKQVEYTKEIPDISARMAQHVEETEHHAELIETCLARFDTSPSMGKDTLNKAIAAMGGIFSNVPADALVKNMHSSCAAEHFEIATYTLLIAAASELGDDETEKICARILEEEEDMAAWVLEQLPVIGIMHLEELAQDAADEEEEVE
jgi:ferritin-like metal-binding protein YciE